MRSIIQLTIFTLTCIGTLFISSVKFIDSQLLPKWFVMIGGVLLIGSYSIIHFLINPNKTNQNHKIPEQFGTIIIVSIVLTQAVYGILQYMGILSPTSTLQVTGSFDNPAGFAASLCAGFPFCFLGITQTKDKIRKVFIVASILIIIAIICSESRSGIISIIIVSGYWIGKRIRISSKIKRVLFPILIFGIITGLYYYKKDSADGRMLIWKCSIPMLKENLLTGGGTGTFEPHYMDYQAEYFKERPDNPYSMLADNVQYPFCEYLNIGVSYGIAGLCLTFCAIGYIFKRYYEEQTSEKETAFLCWLAIASFALFSYPLMYPFVWLMLLYSTYLSTYKHIKKQRSYTTKLKMLVAGISLCLFIYTGIQTIQRIKAELEWKEISNLSLLGKTEDVLPRYKEIYTHFKTDRYFLYNYSAELYQAKKYKESLDLALQCRGHWADYDVEMLLGDLYEHMHQFQKAEQHYQWASYMCPNRFTPLYRLTKLYHSQGKKAKVIKLAKMITNKEIKIPSSTIYTIQQEIKNIIDAYK